MEITPQRKTSFFEIRFSTDRELVGSVENLRSAERVGHLSAERNVESQAPTWLSTKPD
jgi:hypothetical protein